jgi:hypothetical protein
LINIAHVSLAGSDAAFSHQGRLNDSQTTRGWKAL